MFFKKDINSQKVFTLKPDIISTNFIKLINLLTDTEIYLTFKQRDEVYKLICKLINMLEEFKYGKND